MTAMSLFRGPALVAAAITMGLMAGLFYAYTCSVMPGLARTDDRTFVSAMQRINVAILNGWFAACFGGALVLTVLAAALHLSQDARPVLPWIVAALVLYVVTLAVTMGINVPLNNALDAAGDPDRVTDLAAVRTRFEAAWVRWNLVRTLACVAAFGCLTWALVVYGRTGLPNGS
ncbi:anthrone oxygenase family protein [Streptosporangium sp. NPDC049078]|uniref:anthrone oxygenase family protein n=1 Tax=unclassified Streptosporangium TaxID=2632669 RepID=UPI0034380DB3